MKDVEDDIDISVTKEENGLSNALCNSNNSDEIDLSILNFEEKCSKKIPYLPTI